MNTATNYIRGIAWLAMYRWKDAMMSREQKQGNQMPTGKHFPSLATDVSGTSRARVRIELAIQGHVSMIMKTHTCPPSETHISKYSLYLYIQEARACQGSYNLRLIGKVGLKVG